MPEGAEKAPATRITGWYLQISPAMATFVLMPLGAMCSTGCAPHGMTAVATGDANLNFDRPKHALMSPQAIARLLVTVATLLCELLNDQTAGWSRHCPSAPALYLGSHCIVSAR